MKKLFTLDTRNILDTLSTFLFNLAILIFIIGFNFTDAPPPSGWYQQFMPNLGGQNISDITFLDSLNGYAVTNLHYILKTTNGGDNWNIIYNDTSGNIFKRVIFLNQNTGFVGGSIISNSLYYILKTSNGGINWFYINAPFQSTYQADMSILNENTIWTVEDESLTGGVFYTSNGGTNWTQQYFGGTSHIYMYNARMGFMDGGGLKRTTDGGYNWAQIPGEGLFSDMHFVDSLTGWKCLQSMKKTTDGGLTWINQILPSGGNISINYMIKFSNVNADTIWGVGGNYYFSPGQSRGMIFRTTNGGQSWLFQIPDTTIHIAQYSFIKFIDQKIGWAYSLTQGGVHTNTGGDTTWYTGIKQISHKLPERYELNQNYPNPFNPRTVIKYEIANSKSQVKLIVYDITGREISTLVNNMQDAGKYEVDFSGNGLSSGVYFYRIIIYSTSKERREVFTETKKMILLK